jgi:prepilin-type N-terminal cleavage/methylation domain-containing protein
MQPRQEGFTLLEAVVALAIVAMVVTGYLGIRTNALLDGIEARNWRLAREIAEERLSEILAGALETPPQSGVEQSLEERYAGFSWQVVIGESSVSELEGNLASDAAEDDVESRDRNEWQQNRDLYRKASARGLTALEYQDELAAEEYQRRIDGQAPSEDEFEQVAVVVYFPKLNARYEGQRESFLIKSRISTLALSGLTPEQARQIAEAQGSEDSGALGAQPGTPGQGGN